MRWLLLLALIGGCGCQPRVTTLSEAWARERPKTVRYKVIRRCDEQLRVIFWNEYGDTVTFDFDWPRESGVVLDRWRLETADGSDPRILREKYLFCGR